MLAFSVELRIPQAQSLKDKRQVVRHLLDASRSRFAVSAAEVDHQDERGRASLGFAVVASSARQAQDVIETVERFVWSHPEIEVIDAERTWLEV